MNITKCEIDEFTIARTEDQLSRFYGHGRGKLCTDTRGFSSAHGFEAKCNHLLKCIDDNDEHLLEFCKIIPRGGIDLMMKLSQIISILEKISNGDVEGLYRNGSSLWNRLDPDIKKAISKQIISDSDIKTISNIKTLLNKYMDLVVSISSCPVDSSEIRKQWFGVMIDTSGVLLELYSKIFPMFTKFYIYKHIPGLQEYIVEIDRINSVNKILDGGTTSQSTSLFDKFRTRVIKSSIK